MIRLGDASGNAHSRTQGGKSRRTDGREGFPSRIRTAAGGTVRETARMTWVVGACSLRGRLFDGGAAHWRGLCGNFRLALAFLLSPTPRRRVRCGRSNATFAARAQGEKQRNVGIPPFGRSPPAGPLVARQIA